MRFDTRKTRDQQQPPNYFSRREQYRLLALVFALGIAFWAMRKAADPTTWGWFVGDPVATASEHGHSTQEDHEIDTRRDAYEPLPQDFFRVPPPAATAQSGPSSAFPGVDPNWLAILQDDTVFRSAETEAWYGMLNLARQASTDDLAAHSVGRVGFTQLYQQPDSYRGRSIELSGVVRRCHHIDAHSNNEGIEGYYRCWLWPHGSSNPVVLYCLQMPAGFPTGMSIDEPATVRGLFYKRWAYKAVKDIRIAPLVIANTIKWQPRPQGARTMPPRQHLLGWGYDRTPCLGAGFLDGGLGLQLLQAQHLTASRDRPAEYDRYLKLFELSPPHSLKLADGSEITPTEAVVLQRSLEAVSRLPDHLAARWQDYGVTFEQILTDPAAHRCRLISLQGRLKSIVPTAHPVAQAETETIYRAMIEVPEGDHIQLLDLYTPHVPEPWQPLIQEQREGNRRNWDERVSATALLLKRTSAQRLLLVANRLRWHPQTVSEQPMVDLHHVALGSLGLDIGLIYEPQGVGRLAAGDAPAFYSTLATMKRSVAGQFEGVSPRTGNVVQLLQLPESHRGNLFRFTGNARRILKIMVQEESIRELYGLDHYYEVVLFVDPEAIVRVQGDAEDKFFSTYPVVFCCTQLPTGCPEGEMTNVNLSITGMFLKNWQYETQFLRGVKSQGGKPVQTSPLLIGKAPELIMAPQPDSHLGTWLGMAIVALVGCTTAILWRINQADASIARKRRAASEKVPHHLE